MKLSLIAAVSENGIIGNGTDIPWNAKGEQLLFKALTYNQWLLVGRKTFESTGVLPNRKYAVISRSLVIKNKKNVLFFSSVEDAFDALKTQTKHLIVSGGGEIYRSLIERTDYIHLSIIHTKVYGDVFFPKIPKQFIKVFSQHFESNIDYTYEIWSKS